MNQGFVLTQYFYEQMVPFEKDPASLKDTIGEMVYSMDVDQQVHRARQTVFDKEADQDVLQRSKPRQLTGLDLAEARLARRCHRGQRHGAKGTGSQTDAVPVVADAARAHFILARVDLMTVHPDESEDEAERTINDAVEQFKRRWPPARISDCSPGRTSIWAACSIWSASATRRWPSTRRLWRCVTANWIRALPPSAA